MCVYLYIYIYNIYYIHTIYLFIYIWKIIIILFCVFFNRCLLIWMYSFTMHTKFPPPMAISFWYCGWFPLISFYSLVLVSSFAHYLPAPLFPAPPLGLLSPLLLWLVTHGQAECTPFVWAKEAHPPSPFPFSNGRPPFQPVRHFPAPSSPHSVAIP